MKKNSPGKLKVEMEQMKKQIHIMLESPAAMKELIQYFETHGRLLDRQEMGDGAASALTGGGGAGTFISCIKFNGVPILPPVMTNSKREEVRQARHQAAFREKRLKARQRKHLIAVASSLVQNAEASQGAGGKPGKAPASRLPLVRPPALKPVSRFAWASVSSGGAAASAQSNESSDVGSTMGLTSTLGNTFATAEQAHEDFGLHTLDSVCSDFMSLEETLPTDFGGVPLTSVKQQKISHDLLRLSKVLKVSDFNSTGGSDVSELPVTMSAANFEQSRWAERVRSGNTSTLDNISTSFFHESQDTVVEVSAENVTENTTSGFVDNVSNDAESSSQGEGNLSGMASSITSGMSSANTTGTSESQRSNRSSPRSLKNTVHFASFVTEYIDTSASLSSENITVVKKKMSAELDEGGVKRLGMEKTELSAADTTSSKQGGGDGLLSKVALCEPDSPDASLPGQPGLPFQSYSKAELSTSDKENDSKQANKISRKRDNVQSTSENQPGRGARDTGIGRDSVGLSAKADSAKSVADSCLELSSDVRADRESTLKSENSSRRKAGATAGASISDSQGSSRSDTTAATSSSSSTLIEDAITTSTESTSLPLNIVESDKSKNPPPDNTKREESRHSRKEKDNEQPAARKSKKLLPEPPQHAARQGKSGTVNSERRKEGEEQGHRGLVRCGSYTLLAPSPALVRAQGLTGEGSAAGGDGVREKQRRPHYDDAEDHTKPLNVPSVPSEPESAGKAEHISKYLSQVQLHSLDDVTASHLSVDLDSYDPEVSAQLHSSINILTSLMQSQGSSNSAGRGEALQQFQSLRQDLLAQQQRELEELFISQRREQMFLQAEIEDHHKRMKEQQDFLVTNAPENIKVRSHTHAGELSPDTNSDDDTNVKKFNFPPPKQASQGGGAGMVSPSTLMFNTSASSTSPKVRRPVLRSPVKFYPSRRPAGRVVVPPEAYEPHMMEKFDKVTAAARGFLTRHLLNSDKVQGLVKTIKDTREFAFSFQAETPIKKGNFSSQDRSLLERIVAQLQAALLDVHEIFFDTPIADQMALIEVTRLNSRERSFKASTDESLRGSGPRISAATLKALERKKKAQAAEASVFGDASIVARPRTAPSTSSPRSHIAVDLSGPLKRHYRSMLAKAMKPAAMQALHSQLQLSSVRPDNSTARSDKNRPQTAPEKTTFLRPKKPVTTSVSTDQSRQAVRPKLQLQQQQQQQPQLPHTKSSKSSKSTKSWR